MRNTTFDCVKHDEASKGSRFVEETTADATDPEGHMCDGTIKKGPARTSHPEGESRSALNLQRKTTMWLRCHTLSDVLMS